HSKHYLNLMLHCHTYILSLSFSYLSFIIIVYIFFFFFFNDTATTEIYTLSLHDALPIFGEPLLAVDGDQDQLVAVPEQVGDVGRSEEHTSELQSRGHLVCRLLLEKKKK